MSGTITAEEIIGELNKMLQRPEIEPVYSKKIQEIIGDLKNNRYQMSEMLPSEKLVHDLRSVGFHDLAERLTFKGGMRYGR